LLLATDNASRTVFHEVAKSFNEEKLQGIMNLAKNYLIK
jgi:hypothetical protein